MKLSTQIATALAGAISLLAIGLNASAATNPIVNSKHNMKNTFGNNAIPGNQVCLPCHTPHNPPAGNPDEVLWNHQMNPASFYKLYNTDHTTRYSATNYVGIDDTSRMCLSCHDGTIAVDAYGSHAGTPANTIGATSSTGGFVIGGGGDLSHDHPVGIRYPGYTSAGAGVTWAASAGSGYKDPATWSTATFVDNAGATVKSVGGGAVKLFKQTDADGTATVVGCGSCHTPHSDAFQFVRIPNTNSQLCLLCHDK